VAAPDVRRATVPTWILTVSELRQVRALQSTQVGKAARDGAVDGADLQPQTARGKNAAWYKKGQGAATAKAATSE